MPCSTAVMDLLFPSTYCDAYVCVSVCTSAFSHFHLQEFIILQAACLYLSHAPRCFVQRREIHTYACSLTRMHAASSYFLLINDCGANQNACNSSIPSDCLSSILGFSPRSCLEHILKCFDLSRKHAGKRKGAFFLGGCGCIYRTVLDLIKEDITAVSVSPTATQQEQCVLAFVHN